MACFNDGMNSNLVRIFLLACSLLLGHALANPEAAKAAQGCERCGPAPCCRILWVTWCGCPFKDPGSDNFRAPKLKEAQDLMLSRCSAKPSEAVLSNAEMETFLEGLRKSTKPVSCLDHRSVSKKSADKN